jgi:hypothetical protein
MVKTEPPALARVAQVLDDDYASSVADCARILPGAMASTPERFFLLGSTPEWRAWRDDIGRVLGCGWRRST